MRGHLQCYKWVGLDGYYGMGWLLVIIGHRSSKSTFGANKVSYLDQFFVICLVWSGRAEWNLKVVQEEVQEVVQEVLADLKSAQRHSTEQTHARDYYSCTFQLYSDTL